MKKESLITQCDHCEIVIFHVQDNKILTDRDFFDSIIITKKGKINGQFCSKECLLNELYINPLSVMPIFSSKIIALESLIMRLKKEQEQIYKKHAIIIPQSFEEKNKVDKNLEFAKNIKIDDPALICK